MTLINVLNLTFFHFVMDLHADAEKYIKKIACGLVLLAELQHQAIFHCLIEGDGLFFKG